MGAESIAIGSANAWARGHVVATDIDTRFLETLKRPNLEVCRHDITRDPLPEEAFDLIHARMVLIHLPERDLVLRRLAAALKPGGWLVCEEFDGTSAPPNAGPASRRGRLENTSTPWGGSTTTVASTGGTEGCCSANSDIW